MSTGWKLVPLEPSEEMVSAATELEGVCGCMGPSISGIFDIYKRMLDAAPAEDVRAVVDEPVAVTAVAVTREDEDEGLVLEWLLEGGISELEFAGTVLFAMPEANDLCDEDGSAELYRNPQRPLVMPERDSPVNYGDVPFSEGWNACIDEFEKLNGKG